MENKKYRYKAFDEKNNKISSGILQVKNPGELQEVLSESKLTLISYTEIKKSFLNFSFLEKITTKDLIVFFIHLEQLEKAGVSLLDSLADLRDYSDKQKIRDMARDIYESIRGGKLMSEAMEKYKNIFNNATINLVAIGEKTGTLQRSFKNIYENLKWSEEIKKKTIKAIRYPLFSLLVMIITAGVLLKVVVPKVTGFILDQGIEIPSYTTALIATSNFFQNYFFKIILGFFVLWFIIKILYKFPIFNYYFDLIKLKTPIFGEIITKLDMSKFTKFFGVTFFCGIPIIDCLKISREMASNYVIKMEISKTIEDVNNGKLMSDSLSNSSYFPSMVLRMLKVGEDSGNISDAMENIEYFYSREVNDSIDKIVGSLQPAIMFLMGGLMAWIVIAVFGPIYGNFDNLT